MASNISVLSRGKQLGSSIGARGRTATRGGPSGNGSLPVQGQIASNTGLQPGGVIPNGTVQAPAPGTNPPSPDPSSYLVPGTVSQTPFPAPLASSASNANTGIMSHTTTLFGYTAPTVLWVGGAAILAWIIYSMMSEGKKHK